MRVDFYHLNFEAPLVTFHLWSPWRAAELEHRLFHAVRDIPRVEAETSAEEWRLQVRDPKTWRAAVQAVARVLKGWQDDAEMGTDRRSWRWLLEGDTNADGYDATGEPFSAWGFLRVALDHGGLGEGEKGEDIDLDGFGLRVWGEANKR